MASLSALLLAGSCLLVVIFVFFYQENLTDQNAPRPMMRDYKAADLSKTAFKQMKVKKDEPVYASNQHTATSRRDNKPFAYYVLTESCLDSYYHDNNTLGNSTVCDVYVNSYKKPCPAVGVPSHVTYVYDNSTTWTSGRNMLMNVAMATGLRYNYHIFLDGDITLLMTSRWDAFCLDVKTAVASAACSNAYFSHPRGLKLTRKSVGVVPSPFREWERDLIFYSPAIAVPNIHLVGSSAYLLQKKQYSKVCSGARKMPWVAPTVFLDAMFMAYHDDALPLMLPYSTIFDRLNWWTSALFQIFRAKELFYKQMVGNFKITAFNSQHSKYPQSRTALPKDVLMRYLKEEETKLEDVIDIRAHAIANFNSFQKWFDQWFGNPIICTASLKFPIAKHYRIPNKGRPKTAQHP